MHKKMTIGIIGASGMLGYGVSAYFDKQDISVVRITHSEYDIAKEPLKKLEDILSNNSIDVVANCTGIIKPMIPQTSMEDILKINAIFPRNLAKLCKNKEIYCFHITTDCVFNGNKGQYTEDDLYDADDLYGLSKAAGEPTNCMTLRISIIGEEKNRSRSLLEWAISQKGADVLGFRNHLWNGITTIQFARAIDRILSTDLYYEGIFHIFSPDTISKKDLLEIFNNVYNLGLRIKTVDAGQKIDRTLSSKYDISSQICKESIADQIKTMKELFHRDD